MSGTPIRNDRGLSPIRGYPPLVRDTVERKMLFAVIGLVVRDKTAASSELRTLPRTIRRQTTFSAEDSMVRHLSRCGQVCFERKTEKMTLWRLYMDQNSEILERTRGTMLNYDMLEKMADKIVTETQTTIQLVVSSVYSQEFDLSLAMDEVATLARHAEFLNISSSVCGHRSQSVEEQFPDAGENITQQKHELEKLFFNYAITLKFPQACESFLKIVDLELKNPETALFVKTRVCNRLAGIIYTLGSPPNHGPENPLKNNVMAEIDGLNAAGTVDEMKKGIREIFAMLEEDYHVDTSPSRVDQIAVYIQENYQDCNLDATRICELYGITPPSLSRMFRRERGMTMLDYVHSVRLFHVKKLLLETEETLQEIAAQCGYYSCCTMSRVFKKYEGITLSEYRSSCFEKKEN